mmetsp:Transcript_29402/g.75248  ORF Transcript_29402/g.75248 Transcript_29402/m.75248 type:complete len:1189 (+) Transcript_29402:29-3595(+)
MYLGQDLDWLFGGAQRCNPFLYPRKEAKRPRRTPRGQRCTLENFLDIAVSPGDKTATDVLALSAGSSGSSGRSDEDDYDSDSRLRRIITTVTPKAMFDSGWGQRILYPAGLAQMLRFVGSGAAPAGVAISGFSLPSLNGAGWPTLPSVVSMPLVQISQSVASMASLSSALGFVGSLHGLSSHESASRGNFMGMVAMAGGIYAVFCTPGVNLSAVRFALAFAPGAAVGLLAAFNVSMEEMPQMVAVCHSFVGLAAALVGAANYCGADVLTLGKALETFLGISVGSVTFTGSLVAAGKLHGILPGSSVISPFRRLYLLGTVFVLVAGGTYFCYTPSGLLAIGSLVLNAAVSGKLGWDIVMGVGGADMPIVVSMLNSLSGVATSAAGFALNNELMVVTGALVTSSGAMLSDMMCRGINRSPWNVILGGFGVAEGTVVSSPGQALPVTEVTPDALVTHLIQARRVVIVPGYGMAVARCQQRLGDIAALLSRHGVHVRFAVHPVAGRLPGHMNVLLAEANVAYDTVQEMDEVNPRMSDVDVCIVVGANDIVNPDTKSNPHSTIYGMPALEVWNAKKVVVLKRSMATGYSGVENPLFHLENTMMVFGDAKTSADKIYAGLDQRQAEIAGQSGGESTDNEVIELMAEDDYPEAVGIIGVVVETAPGESRVALVPEAVPKLRELGFSILLQKGAGAKAGMCDEAYSRLGGVQVVDTAQEVFQAANVVLKVGEPTLEEAAMTQANQIVVGCFRTQDCARLLHEVVQRQATLINMACIPRISRAQTLDVLTSMANIAGYRSVIDAFNRLPRFSRTAVTASGRLPPAKVFVIGAGVAGLSAIATAHSLGAKVYATDVRSAAREQVESMGAEFVTVNQSTLGEGVGGYATEVSENFQEAQRRLYTKYVMEADVVITTAMLPHAPAPILISRAMVGSMRSGSVVVDLAAAGGGNCELTQKDQVITDQQSGVTIVGVTNYPSQMAAQSSSLLSNNMVAFLKMIANSGQAIVDLDDAVLRASCAAHQGHVLPPPPPPAAAPEPTRPAGADGPTAAELQDQLAGLDEEQFNPAFRPVVAYIRDNRGELASALGWGAVAVLGCQLPPSEVVYVGYYALSLLLGQFTVASVTPALHTPLISVTNAISGIIVVGGMLQMSGPLLSAKVAWAMLSVFFSSVNVVGGFAVTQRMLQMFKPKPHALRSHA